MATRRVKVTDENMKKAIGLFNRSLLLQRAMYDFREELTRIGRDDLMQLLEDGAFEMDLTWNNAETVAKKLTRMYKDERGLA